MRYFLISLLAFSAACGDEPDKKVGSTNNAATNNAATNNAATNNAATNNAATNNAATNNAATNNTATNNAATNNTATNNTATNNAATNNTATNNTATNTAPTVNNVAVTPVNISWVGQPLTCSYTFADADGDLDASTIEWLIDGAVVGTGPTFANYGEKDEITCRVTADDGMDSGNVRVSNAVVAPLRLLISASASHTCIRTPAGGVKCWGDNSYKRVGSDTPGRILTPVEPAGLDSDVDAVVAGERHSCALQRDAVKCWGRAIDGVLGDVAQDSAVPTTVLTGGITALESGYNHVCAIQNGALKCWGFNAFGQLGHDQNFGSISEGVKTPITVPGLGSGVTQVVAGEDHTCALQGDTMRCWGSNAFGELGRQTTESRTYLPDITLNTGVSQVFAGGLHTCAVHNGDLKCWGANYDRQLGNTSTEGILRTPTLVTSITGTFEALYLGGSNTCVTQNGATSCWGSGDDGIMQGAARTHLPVSIYAVDTTAFAIGESHMCGAQQAALSCWGSNWAGQTGNPATAGEFVDGPTPYFINFQ